MAVLPFRMLSEPEVEEFRTSARRAFDTAAAGDGKLVIDVALFHPVYLDQLAEDLANWAAKRMELVG